ncbi:MAG: double-strand break repair helicase AddA, partial [Acetobacteraceae bacterium]
MSAPTDPQRRAADPGASSWVSASAGSGKTRLLVDRVLRLMLSGTDPARVLCLTFTRAAAAEMATRLQSRLGGWATATDGSLASDLAELTGAAPDEALLARARGLFARVLDLPGGMKISTLHAFAQGLLRRFPVEAGIAPQFGLVEEAESAALLAEAQETALAAAVTGAALEEAVNRLAALADVDRLSKATRALLPARGRPGLATRANSPEAVAAAQRRVLGLDLDETPETVRLAGCRRTAEEAGELCRLAAVWLQAGGGGHEQRGRTVREWLAASDEERAGDWQRWRRLFLTDKGEPRARTTVTPQKVLAIWPEAYDAVLREAGRILATEERCRAAELALASAALATLALPVIEGYARAKSARAALDYDDLIAAAKRLLETDGAAGWVHYKLDQGIDHVLLDEAQDTNPDQWAIVGALTAEFFTGAGARPGPRTMFAVGDEKQSIYGFQGAEPAEFGRWKTVFAERCAAAGAAWRPESLTLSFRSTTPVLALVDAVFAGEAARGVSFAGEPIRHRAARAGQAGSVELWPIVEGRQQEPPEDVWAPIDSPVTDSDPSQRLAEAIARRIRWWIERRETLPARGRAIRAGDIMVLVRRRDAFVARLVRELKREAVPVSGLDRLTLVESLAVQDLLALCRVALLPEADELSLAEVLRGPFCSVDEDGLFALARDAADPARPRGATLWSVLRDRRAERPEWEAAAALIETVSAKADFLRPYDLLAHVLCEHRFPGTGREVSGRWRLRRRLGPDAADPVEELLNQALAYERTQAPSLQGFLHWLDHAGIEVKREQEGAGDAVRVMTVHAAKGLQAPIVILPDTTGMPRFDDTVLWAEDTLPHAPPVPLWAPREAFRADAFDRLRTGAKARQDAEHRRLLYVALTRAEDRLIVCGWRGGKAPDESCWYRLVERGFERLAGAERVPFDSGGWMGEGGWRGEGWRFEAPQTAEPRAEPEEADRRVGVRPPLWAETPPPAEPAAPRPIRPSREDGEDQPAAPPVRADDRSGARFRRGALIHALLQHLPDLPEHER